MIRKIIEATFLPQPVSPPLSTSVQGVPGVSNVVPDQHRPFYRQQAIER
jgi:hypothetical protein